MAAAAPASPSKVCCFKCTYPQVVQEIEERLPSRVDFGLGAFGSAGDDAGEESRHCCFERGGPELEEGRRTHGQRRRQGRGRGKTEDEAIIRTPSLTFFRTPFCAPGGSASSSFLLEAGVIVARYTNDKTRRSPAETRAPRQPKRRRGDRSTPETRVRGERPPGRGRAPSRTSSSGAKRTAARRRASAETRAPRQP